MTCKYSDWSRGEDEALLNILGGLEVARGVLDGSLKVVVKQSDLLKQVATATVSDTQRFVVDEEAIKSANIGWIGENFKKFFAGKVEENVPACSIAVHHLERASLDAPILEKLGDKAEVPLVHLFNLLKKQANGEDGTLLTGNANIFHIRDNEGRLWAVEVYWYSDYRYWCVGAGSVESLDGWDAGDQVVSRDS